MEEVKRLIKPMRLQRGDKVATVSLSWGGAGDEEISWRYEQGKKRLVEQFGLEVIEMPHTLAGSDFIEKYPEKRAEDLMNAFKDSSIKGIISCIGGDDSIRMLPYIDFEVIRENPKIFMGYSDTTITHLICYKAGLSSFYGPAILSEFAENVCMFEYTTQWIEKVLFAGDVIGEIEASPIWTSEYLPWVIENKETQRRMLPHPGFDWLQGTGIVTGRLFGGCIEVLEMAKGTEIWPDLSEFEDYILFFETSEDTPEPSYLKYWLRNYGAQGILQKVRGIMFGKPYDDKYADDYRDVIKQVIIDELGLAHLTIVLNLNFGHTAPMMVLPYGGLVEIDNDHHQITFLECGTIT